MRYLLLVFLVGCGGSLSEPPSNMCPFAPVPHIQICEVSGVRQVTDDGVPCAICLDQTQANNLVQPGGSCPIEGALCVNTCGECHP